MSVRMAAVVFLVALLAAGCGSREIRGSGVAATETRDVSGITGISLQTSGDLVIKQTGEESLTVTADDNVIGHIATEVKNGTLTIKMTDVSGAVVSVVTPIRFELTVKSLQSIALLGGAAAKADSLAADNFAIAVGSSGSVSIGSLVTGPLSVAISGSGEVSVAGRADTESVAISGSGSYAGDELAADRASVAISGSGDAAVWAETALDVNISGSGSVTYRGEPEITKHVTGSGTVEPAGPHSASI
jgi:hypothetical protein